MEVLIDTQPGWEISCRSLGSSAKDALLVKVKATLHLMDSIANTTCTCSASPDAPSLHAPIIIPWEWFSVASVPGEFIRRVDARILKCSYLKKPEVLDELLMAKASDVSELKEVLESNGNVHPFLEVQEKGIVNPISSIIDIPWAESLRYKVWLPPTLCQREKYCVLANAFWAMTYNGFPATAQDIPENPLCKSAAFSQSTFCSDAFEREYLEKMEELVDLLNYNSWVDAMRSIWCACRAA